MALTSFQELNMKRDKKNAVIGGVCAGIANDLGIDAVIVRLVFLCAFIFAGIGPLIYLILWVIMGTEE
jgi:phage shock protein PspC (stress-responsive transcriptional regulator)